MTTVSRTFEVELPPEDVIAYLADFTNAEEWDPGTESCRRQDTGPVQVGSSWHNTSKVAGLTTELTYTLEAVAPDKVVLVGRNDTVTSTDTIQVTAEGSGSTITYTAVLDFRGEAKLAAPLAKVVMTRVGQETEKQLVEVLNRKAVGR